MPKSLDEELKEFRRELREDAKEIRQAFKGEYAGELEELYGLSQEKIDALVPGTTDLETYAKLIEVVKLASRRNLSQAALRGQIESLGELAVSIAKLSGRLAAIFV